MQAVRNVRGKIERERLNADIARQLHDRHKAAGLTQKALADLVGTTTSVISRLEDADYGGRSLRMLHRIAVALDLRLHVQLVAASDSADAPAATVSRA